MVLDADSHPQNFQVDEYYSDDEPVCLGDISIRTMLTPGHTVGCTSFFWEEKNPVNGQIYQIAMHGGVGAYTYIYSVLRFQPLSDAGSAGAFPGR